MAEKRPFSRPALQSLPTNLPVKKPKHDSKKNDETTTKKVLPLKKNSLVHKLSERSTRDYALFHPLEEQLFKEGYQKDYVKFLLSHEKKFVLDKNFLQTTVFSSTSRYTTVDLLLKMQKYFKTPDNEFYITVKLMDYASKICVVPSEGVLLAITSFWLVHKFLDNDVFISPKSILKYLKVIPWIKHSYRKEDIIKMERRILIVTGFTIQLPDPTTFIEHFMRKLKLLQSKQIYFGSYFVCDCISMFPKFSYLQTSLVAGISLYTTLIVMKQDTSTFLQMTQNVFQEKDLKGYCSDVILKIKDINKMLEFREPFVKYSGLEKIGIANYFENYVKKLTIK